MVCLVSPESMYTSSDAGPRIPSCYTHKNQCVCICDAPVAGVKCDKHCVDEKNVTDCIEECVNPHNVEVSVPNEEKIPLSMFHEFSHSLLLLIQLLFHFVVVTVSGFHEEKFCSSCGAGIKDVCWCRKYLCMSFSELFVPTFIVVNEKWLSIRAIVIRANVFFLVKV